MGTTPPLDVAVDAVTAAGETLRAAFESPIDIQWKGETDIVTSADLAAEHTITERIAAHYPDHTIIAEESGEHPGSTARWYVDPLDGTTNFAHGIPHYSVSVALERDETVVLGVTYLPAHDDVFAVVRGEPPTRNGEPITVSDTTDLDRAVIALGYSRTDPGTPAWLDAFTTITDAALRTRHMGSIATDLALVANGTFDGLYGTLLQPWDVAAGIPLVEAAGGTITPLNPERPGLTGGYVATNGHLHDDLRACLPPTPD